jgi:hypothetical protein
MRNTGASPKARLKDLLKGAATAHAAGVLTGVLSVLIFVLLGGLLTSSVHLAAYGQWEWLHAQAMLAIGLPAFLTGWAFTLLIPVLIRRRRTFVMGAGLLAIFGSAVHRLIFVSRALTWRSGGVDVLSELEQNVYACMTVFGAQWCTLKETAHLDYFSWDWALGAEVLAVFLALVLAYVMQPYFWDRMAQRHITVARHPGS